MPNIGPLELAIVLVIALVIFGPKRLPDLGRSLGSGMREFKDSLTGKDDDDDEEQAELEAATSQPQPDDPRSSPSRVRSSPTTAPRRDPIRSAVARRLKPAKFDDRMTLVEHLDELRTRIIVSAVVLVLAVVFCFWQNHALLDDRQRAAPPASSSRSPSAPPSRSSPRSSSRSTAASCSRCRSCSTRSTPSSCPRSAPASAGSCCRCCSRSRSCSSPAPCSPTSSSCRRRSTSCSASTPTSSTSRSAASEYYGFFVLTLIGVGLLFQIPVGVLAVTRLGIVTPQQLAHNRRYAILIIAVVAMLLPGTDPVTMLICDAPLYLLFELSLLLARWFGGPAPTRRRRRPGSQTAFLYAPDPMLFDLKSGKRRRVVQIVFGFLAFIFFISFVGFGIGSDVSGGIFDALGIGGGDSAATRSTSSRSRTPRRRSRPNPNNQQAPARPGRCLLSAPRHDGVTTDEADRPDVDQRGGPRRARAGGPGVDDYMTTKPKNTDLSTAANAVQVFVLLGDAEGAAEAQAVVAEGQRTAAAYGQLAYYYYAAGKMKQGDEAGEEGGRRPPIRQRRSRSRRPRRHPQAGDQAAGADRGAAAAGRPGGR